MSFLVQIEVVLPVSLPEEEEGASLLGADLARGRELKAAGSIVEIYRVPGGLRNVGIWEAADATEVHGLIASLPHFPHVRAEVRPLAVHSIDQ